MATSKAGQLIARGENVWLIRVYLGRDGLTGKRKFYNATVHGTKRAAQTILNQALLDRDSGRISAASTATTIGSLLDDLLHDYKSNGKGYAWAETLVRVHLRPFFGEVSIAKLTSDHVKSYVAARREGGKRRPAANATINNELALLHRAFQLGTETDPPKVLRVPRIKKLGVDNIRKGFFGEDEYRRMRDALPSDLRPVLTFAFFSGCRKGEILSLRWDQVDLIGRMVRLEAGETKNGEPREIPLMTELYETLKMKRSIRDREYPQCSLVFSRGGEPILNFRKAWDSACITAGLAVEVGVDANKKPVYKATRIFHDLRRTGVRNLVRAGVPEKVAMRISGHKTRAVFDRYNIVSQDDLRDAARKLDAFFAKPKTQRHTIGTQGPIEQTKASQATPASH